MLKVSDDLQMVDAVHLYVIYMYKCLFMCLYTYFNVWVYICKQVCYAVVVSPSNTVAQYSFWRARSLHYCGYYFFTALDAVQDLSTYLCLSISVIALSFAWKFSLSLS